MLQSVRNFSSVVCLKETGTESLLLLWSGAAGGGGGDRDTCEGEGGEDAGAGRKDQEGEGEKLFLWKRAEKEGGGALWWKPN